MKIASVFKGGITVCLFIIIIFTFVNSVSYEQESKENVQRQDMNTVTGMRAVKTDSGSLPQNLENKYDMPGAFYDNQLSGSAGSGELFNDPFLSRKWREWPEKDFFYFAPTDSIYNFVNPLQMRTLLQNHHILNLNYRINGMILILSFIIISMIKSIYR